MQTGRPFDVELWKHFASTGATDKNTMITIVSGLLAIVSGAIGYMFSTTAEPRKVLAVAVLGTVVSVLALVVTIVYAGYTNRNWARADDIALESERSDLVDWKSPSTPRPTGWTAKLAWRFSKPCEPRKSWPTVFWVYALLSVAAITTNVVFLTWALCRH